MSDQLDLSQHLEIHDAAGHMVGLVLAPKVVQNLTAERDQLRAEVDRLRAEMAAITAERDAYLKSLYALMEEKVRFAPEELAEMERNGLTMEAIIAEIESDFRSRGLLNAE